MINTRDEKTSTNAVQDIFLRLSARKQHPITAPALVKAAQRPDNVTSDRDIADIFTRRFDVIQILVKQECGDALVM